MMDFVLFRLGIVGRCSDGNAAVLQRCHQAEPWSSSAIGGNGGCSGGRGRCSPCGHFIFDFEHNHSGSGGVSVLQLESVGDLDKPVEWSNSQNSGQGDGHEAKDERRRCSSVVRGGAGHDEDHREDGRARGG